MQALNNLTVEDARRRMSELDQHYDAYFGHQLWDWQDVNEVNPGDWDLFVSLNQIIEESGGAQ